MTAHEEQALIILAACGWWLWPPGSAVPALPAMPGRGTNRGSNQEASRHLPPLPRHPPRPAPRLKAAAPRHPLSRQVRNDRKDGK